MTLGGITQKGGAMTEEKKDVIAPAAPVAVVNPLPKTVSTAPVVIYVGPGPMPKLPKLYVTRHALLEMTTEVLAHPDTETAWGLYGFRYPEAVFVVGVIRPVSSEVIRGYAHAEAGGIEMANAMHWLSVNEELINAKVGQSKPDHGKFTFLYKGHSHHTLGFTHYSSTDQESIYQVVKNDGLDIAIGPLAMIKSNGVTYSHATWSNEVSCSRYSKVAFLMYMMTKEMIDAGYFEAVEVKPTIIDTVHTLLVPPLGWEFARDDEFKAQIRNLKNFGCQVKVNHIDVNGKPPLEIQFVIDHKHFKMALIITTDWNYPEVPPRIMLMPKPGINMSMAEANRLSSRSWWTKGDDFIDIIGKMIEQGVLE